jgi:hypothetical protein
MENSISMYEYNGTSFTAKHGDDVSVDYDRITTVSNNDRIIAVSNSGYITQAELDETGSVISYTLMCNSIVLLDLDADEYKKFNNNDLLISGERLRMTVKKMRKEKKTK